MKSTKMIATMVMNEVRAAHEMYEALLQREYDFNQMMADICMEMNNDIIDTIMNIKSPDVDFDMTKYCGRLDHLVYRVHSVLMIASYMEDRDVEEIITNVTNQFIRTLDKLINEYEAPQKASDKA